MKPGNLFLSSIALCSIGFCLFRLAMGPAPVAAFSDGPTPRWTGASSEGTCRSCHSSYQLNDASGGVVLDGLPDSYAPGQPVQFTITISQDGTNGVRKDWGFQLTVLDGNNRFAGTLVASDPNNTLITSRVVEGNTRYYIEQTLAGSYFNPNGSDSATWTVTWQPPDSDVGPVTFYVASVAGDGGHDPAGDYAFQSSQTVPGPSPTRLSRPRL